MGKAVGINREPQLVRLMEINHSKAQIEIRNFLRKLLIRAPIFVLILPVLTWDWITTPVLIITNSIFYILCYRHVKKSVYLGKVDNIMFVVSNSVHYPNQEEVYNATLKICEMKGCINAVSKTLDIYNVCEIFFVSSIVIANLIKFIIGGK